MPRPDLLSAPAVVQPDYGATVLERLLLAIINAHTSSEADGPARERLAIAMTALVGQTPRAYRHRAPDDAYFHDILEAEAVQRLCDELAEWDVPTRF